MQTSALRQRSIGSRRGIAGFSLLEMILVVALIAIASTMALAPKRLPVSLLVMVASHIFAAPKPWAQ